MANVKEYTKIMHDMEQGKFAPIYLLHGEEPFYIDRISKYIEHHAIEEHERDFNLTVFYGRDLQEDHLLDSLKRFPMMAKRQVIIIREAQDYGGKWENLEAYFKKPIPTTLLVIDHKYKKVDSRKTWPKLVGNSGVIFHSAKHYDSDLPQVVTELTKAMKYRIQPAAAHLLAEYLGNDLEKIEGELRKLTINVPLSQAIDQDDVRTNIGISKNYNVFEYVEALAVRDQHKSYKIAQFIGKNEKNTPILMVIGALFTHFSKVLMFHMLQDKSRSNVIRSIPGVGSPWSAGKLMDSVPHYSAKKASEIIEKLREADAQFKGVNAAPIKEDQLIKELTYYILN